MRTLQVEVPVRRRATRGNGSLADLRRNFSEASLKAAAVASWARSNTQSLSALGALPATGRTLTHLDSDAVAAFGAVFGPAAHHNLADLAAFFEGLVDSQRRKEDGVVYTPEFISRYLVAEGFKLSGATATRVRICDPCCGGGAFVIAAARFLRAECGIPVARALKDHIWGFDIEPRAVTDTQCLAELLIVQEGGQAPDGGLNFHVVDAFAADYATRLQEVGCPGGFDVVATNPPYVKVQNLPTAVRAELTGRFPDLAQGSYSLAMLFLIAAQRWLSPDGILAIITQNNIFTSLAAEEVRRQLQIRRSVRRIVDFGHNQVFANASAYTCLVFCGRSPSAKIDFHGVRGTVTPERLAEAEFSPISVESLDPLKWRLGSRLDLDNLQRIEQAGIPLGELCNIRVGFATLKDRAFLVRESPEGCIGSTPEGGVTTVEREITRPVVKIADLGAESDLPHNSLRILFPYRMRSDRYEPLEQAELARSYPAAFAHLSAWKEALSQRDKGRKNYEPWYAWGRAQGMSAPGPKLLTKTFSRGPNFMLDPTDQLFCNGYAILPPGPSPLAPPISLLALQRILNSSVMYYYARLTSFQIEGGFECYQKNFIERFGIPHLQPDDVRWLETAPAEEAERHIASLYGLELEYLLATLRGAESKVSV